MCCSEVHVHLHVLRLTVYYMNHGHERTQETEYGKYVRVPTDKKYVGGLDNPSTQSQHRMCGLWLQ